MTETVYEGVLWALDQEGGYCDPSIEIRPGNAIDQAFNLIRELESYHGSNVRITVEVLE